MRLQEFTRYLPLDIPWEDLQGYWRDLLYALSDTDSTLNPWPDLVKSFTGSGRSESTWLASYLYRKFPEMEAAEPSDREQLLTRWGEITRLPDENRVKVVARSVDASTESFLADVQAVWDLTPVASFLNRDETDLIVQVDDALHSVPFAFLMIGGHYLFHRVRSVQSVLSPLVNQWLRQAVADNDPAPTQLLTLSWVPEDDWVARFGTRYLHHLQRNLAIRYQATWYSASEEPAGQYGVLAAAMGNEPFAVVTVCGHGVELMADTDSSRDSMLSLEEHPSIPAGVELQDVRWTGSTIVAGSESRPGCDMAPVELLIQVSCSIGRIAQSELRDAEGFCLELAVKRVRSVVAGLWELDTWQSPEFATWVAEEYLKLRAESSTGVDLSDLALRGRALNLARYRWLHEVEGGRSRVGLNTVAAFQLFGLP